MVKAGEYVKAGCFGYLGVIICSLAVGALGCGGCIAMMGGCVIIGGTAGEGASRAKKDIKSMKTQEATIKQNPEEEIPISRIDVETPPTPEEKPPAKQEDPIIQSIPIDMPGPEIILPEKSSNDKLRTWSNATGKFKIEAEFVSKTGNKVKLKKTDGKIIFIQFDQLSEEDQNWIKKKSR